MASNPPPFPRPPLISKFQKGLFAGGIRNFYFGWGGYVVGARVNVILLGEGGGGQHNFEVKIKSA